MGACSSTATVPLETQLTPFTPPAPALFPCQQRHPHAPTYDLFSALDIHFTRNHPIQTLIKQNKTPELPPALLHLLYTHYFSSPSSSFHFLYDLFSFDYAMLSEKHRCIEHQLLQQPRSSSPSSPVAHPLLSHIQQEIATLQAVPIYHIHALMLQEFNAIQPHDVTCNDPNSHSSYSFPSSSSPFKSKSYSHSSKSLPPSPLPFSLFLSHFQGIVASILDKYYRPGFWHMICFNFKANFAGVRSLCDREQSEKHSTASRFKPFVQPLIASRTPPIDQSMLVQAKAATVTTTPSPTPPSHQVDSATSQPSPQLITVAPGSRHTLHSASISPTQLSKRNVPTSNLIGGASFAQFSQPSTHVTTTH